MHAPGCQRSCNHGPSRANRAARRGGTRRLSPTTAERPTGRFIAITDARGMVERYPIDAAITKAYLEARGLDWR